MLIDCYLFSAMARKIDSIYYQTISLYNGSYLYYNLSDFDWEKHFQINTFIYKVEVDSNDVFSFNITKLKAMKYKITEEVPFVEFLKEIKLSNKTRTELNSILNGTLQEDKILNLYNNLINGYSKALTQIQKLKLHAIVSQEQYILPTLEINWRTEGYIRLFEFYNRNYNYSHIEQPNKIKQIKIEILYGSRKFETIDEFNTDDSNLEAYPGAAFLLYTKKLTQKQFEMCCENMEKFADLAFFQSAVFADYEIPFKYQKYFYPHIIFKNPHWLSLLSNTKRKVPQEIAAAALICGYKINDYNYNSYWTDEILKTKKIFKNEDYKYLEIKSSSE